MTDLKIDRPFAIFVCPSYEEGEDGMWNVHIVGHELDNMTCADNPVDAVGMAHDLLQLITGTCGFPARKEGHEFVDRQIFDEWNNEWKAGEECVHCSETRMK